MFKEVPFIEEWIEEGEARGEARATRRMLLRQLQKRFGALPDEVEERVESADREGCERIADRLFDVGSLDELGLSDNGSGNNNE